MKLTNKSALGVWFCLLLKSIQPAFASSWLDTVLVGLQPLGFDSSRAEFKAELHKAEFQVESDSRIVLAEFQGHLFPLHIGGDESYASFKIWGKVQVCFDFKVELDALHGKKGYVSWINTEDSECPLPPDGRGTFLLKLVDRISSLGGVSVVGLEDEATIRCNLDNQPTELSFLRILQKGQSWYGSHGYLPEPKSQNEYKDSVKQLTQITLASFKQEFPGLQNSAQEFASRHSRNFQAVWTAKNLKNNSEDLALWISDFESVHGKNQTLAEFLSWVWKEDCTSFKPISQTIFPKMKWPFVEHFNWLKAIRAVQNNGLHLQKQFH